MERVHFPDPWMYYTTNSYSLHGIGLSLQGRGIDFPTVGNWEGAPPRLGRSVWAGLCTVICTKDHSFQSKPCKCSNPGQDPPVNTTPQDVVGYPLPVFYSALLSVVLETPPVMFLNNKPHPPILFFKKRVHSAQIGATNRYLWFLLHQN